MPSDNRKETLIGILAVVCWSSSIAVGRSITEALGPFTTTATVSLLGGICSAIFGYYRYGSFPNVRNFSAKYFFGCGVLFVLYQATLYVAIGNAINRNQLLEIGLLNYLWPVLTILFSVPILRHRANLFIIPGATIAFLGIALVITQGKEFSFFGFIENIASNPLSYCLAFIAAVTWALYSNLSKLWGAEGKQGAVPIFLILNGLVLFTVSIAIAEQSTWSSKTIAEVSYMVLVSTCGYMFWEIGLRRGNFVIVSISSYFTPLLSTIISCLYLGSQATAQLWTGCAALIVGAYLSKLGVREKMNV